MCLSQVLQLIKEISGPVLGIVGLLFILSGTKLLGRRLNWRIGLGVPLFGLGLFILVTELPQYAIGFSVLATLALAFAAFLTIQNADEREKRHREEELAKEKRDRKERLLNEIIEWAEEIDKASLTPDLTLASKNTTLMMKQREVNVLLRYGICLSKATSIETIASVSFKDELLQDVRKVIDTLVKFICIKQLKSLGVMPTEKAIPAKAREEIRKEIEKGKKSIEQLWDEYASELAKTNRDLLFKANKIKATLLK